MSEFRLRTERLILRGWREEDRLAFATMNGDPSVMEYFVSPLSHLESDELIDRFRDEFAEKGYCPWAVELVDAQTFIGFVGLHTVPADMLFAPATEVGWRLAASYWGQGYASEAATASLGFAFDVLGLDEVVSFTSAINWRSRAVMTRIGMSHDEADDFEHPKVPVGHPLRPHVLYRRRRESGERAAPISDDA